MAEEETRVAQEQLQKQGNKVDKFYAGFIRDRGGTVYKKERKGSTELQISDESLSNET